MFFFLVAKLEEYAVNNNHGIGLTSLRLEGFDVKLTSQGPQGWAYCRCAWNGNTSAAPTCILRLRRRVRGEEGGGGGSGDKQLKPTVISVAAIPFTSVNINIGMIFTYVSGRTVGVGCDPLVRTAHGDHLPPDAHCLRVTMACELICGPKVQARD